MAALISGFLPSESSAFIRHDLPDAPLFVTDSETCRNDPVNNSDPLGLAPGDALAFGTRLLGPDKFDPGFLSSEGMHPDMAVAIAKMEGRLVADYEDPFACVGPILGETSLSVLCPPANWAIDTKDLCVGGMDIRERRYIAGSLQIVGSVVGYFPAIGDLFKAPFKGGARAIRRSAAAVTEVVADDVAIARAARVSILSELDETKEIVLPKGAKNIRQTMVRLSNERKSEVGLFRLKDGRRVMRVGTEGAVDVGEDVVRPIAHTHSEGPLQLSEADIDVLDRFGKSGLSSVLIDSSTGAGRRITRSQGWFEYVQR
ncbi:MAG: hypothetical protein WCS01_12365, partial [bacterium]